MTADSGAAFRVVVSSIAGNVVSDAKTLTVTPAMATPSGTGLSAIYFDNEDFTGTTIKRIDPQLNFTWVDGVPVPGIAGEWWSAIWLGTIDIPADDTYTFAAMSDDGVRVKIDGQEVLADWSGHSQRRSAGTLPLSAGRHSIEVRYYNGHFGGSLALMWSSSAMSEEIIPKRVLYPNGPAPVVGSGSGLCATYYDEDHFGGFTSVKVDGQMDFLWDGQTAPATSIAPDVWSVTWVGQIEPMYTDAYTFSALTNHPFTLMINAQTVIADETDGVEHTATGIINLKAGRRYDVLAKYRSTSSPSRLAVSWSSAVAGGTTLVPQAQLYPVNEGQAAQVQVISPLASYTSPAWVEGTVGHWTTALTATVNGAPLTVARASAAPWYITSGVAGKALGVPLTGPENTLVIDSSNGGVAQQIQQTITWTTIDLANRPYGLDTIRVRPGDSLRLTATGSGSALVVRSVSATGQLITEQAGAPGQVFVVPFVESGVYTVLAELDGHEVSRLAVFVPHIDLLGPIACHINYQRTKDINVTANGASVSIVANDSSLMDVQWKSATATSQRLGLRPLQSGDLSLQARLGEGGPVIAACAVDEFTLRTTAEKRVALVEVKPNGNRVVEAQLVISPLVRDIDVRLTAYTAGITFEDGTLETFISSNQFEPDGQSGVCRYRIILMDGSAVCHNLDSFQGGVRVSEQ